MKSKKLLAFLSLAILSTFSVSARGCSSSDDFADGKASYQDTVEENVDLELENTAIEEF